MWNERDGQLTAGDVVSVWMSWVRSPHSTRQFIGSFVLFLHMPAHVALASKLTPTNIYIARARGEAISAVGCLLIIGTGCWIQVLALSSIAQPVCKRAFIPLEIWFQRPWVRTLHSAEEDNLSPFDRYNFLVDIASKLAPTSMYLCMHVCMCECMYICVCVRACVHACTCVESIGIYIWYIHIHVSCIHVCAISVW